MMITNPPQIDKATLAYASLLGIFEETHITDTDYNNLNTIFYTGKHPRPLHPLEPL